MKFRGYLALAVVCLALVVSDPIQRFMIAPWVKLRPARRIPVLEWWIKLMAWVTTRPLIHIGGATIPVPPRIVPARPGMPILMDHQSVFDLPLVLQTVSAVSPRLWTRDRYRRPPPVSPFGGETPNCRWV